MTQNDQTGLFDDHGRRIPPAGIGAACHRQTRRRFLPVQPTLDYRAIHGRLAARLGGAEALSAEEFERRAQAILDRLADDPATRNMLKGVHIPFFLPQAAHGDIGSALEGTYLGAVEHAYTSTLPGHGFVNHHKTGLAEKLSPLPGTRHERLIEAMGKGTVVGWYFPCLLEFSVPAAVEQMAELPDNFLLAGGYDTCAAFIGSPDLLLRKDGYPPLLWLAGLEGEKEGVGYHFEAYGYDLTFNRRVHQGQAAEYWASALVVIEHA